MLLFGSLFLPQTSYEFWGFFGWLLGFVWVVGGFVVVGFVFSAYYSMKLNKMNFCSHLLICVSGAV